MKKVLIVFLSLGILLSASYYVFLKQKNIKIENKITQITNQIEILIKEKKEESINKKEEEYERIYSENRNKVKEYERWQKMNEKIKSNL